MLLYLKMGERKRGSARSRKRKTCTVCHKVQPSYAQNRHEKASHCRKCAPQKYVDVVTKMCIVCNKTCASLAKPGCTKRAYCRKCAPKEAKDVTKKKCIVCKTTVPSYGEEFGKPTHCSGCAPASFCISRLF